MLQKYELTYIIRPDMEEAAKKELVERFDKILSDNGATISDSSDWQTRKLAYEVDGFKEGIYHIIKFSSQTNEAFSEFDRLAKISSDILRHMIVVFDETKNSQRKPAPRRVPATSMTDSAAPVSVVESESAATAEKTEA